MELFFDCMSDGENGVWKRYFSIFLLSCQKEHDVHTFFLASPRKKV